MTRLKLWWRIYERLVGHLPQRAVDELYGPPIIINLDTGSPPSTS